ncbi:unnamed protein product [Rotaria sp. Silwood2]|nr:unnamed protein product [Rotaria sp. Silwood2]
METLLEDESKFKRIYKNSIITNEDRVNCLLSRLLKEGLITNEEYHMAKPIGSRPARLYDLPKLHKPKENYPLRPVTSAIKTVGYGLRKMLRNRLKHLRTSPYVIENSFDFLNKIKSSKNMDKILASFDVVNLFTNVPLTFTMDFILDQMYPTCAKSCLQLPRIKQCPPVIGDIFMTHLETTLMDRLTQSDVCEWYRYVDDTFVVINKDANVNNILSILNEFHPSIKFTRKIEDNDKLEFLDVQPTFTGVLTNWNSDVPIQYKTASIVSMVNPALNICSTYKLLEHEFNEIRRFGLLNNYPLSFIDTIIGIKLSQHRNKTITKLATTTSSSSLSTTKTAITLIDDTNNDMKMDKSLIYQHEKERGHRMNWSNFQIVW